MKDAGGVREYLDAVKRWLDAHPREVVTVLLTNGDFVDVAEFKEAFNASQIDGYAYVPTLGHSAEILESWPTLSELIDSGKRLVAFLDFGADTERVPYLLPELDYFWETPFDTTDPTFSQCAIDRPEDLQRDPEKAEKRMYIVNHFLDTDVLGMDLPDRRDVGNTNAWGSLGVQVGVCEGLYGGRKPKGVLVDYFERGNVWEVQDWLNGV